MGNRDLLGLQVNRYASSDEKLLSQDFSRPPIAETFARCGIEYALELAEHTEFWKWAVPFRRGPHPNGFLLYTDYWRTALRLRFGHNRLSNRSIEAAIEDAPHLTIHYRYFK